MGGGNVPHRLRHEGAHRRSALGGRPALASDVEFRANHVENGGEAAALGRDADDFFQIREKFPL